MKWQSLCSIFLGAILLAILHSTLSVSAAPPRQNPNPTDEPTKRPYIFPTPIFIPTFVSATDLPPRGATSTPRPAASVADTQPAASPSPRAPLTPTVTRPDSSIVPEESPTPAPEPESDTADLAKAAENALLAMGAVLFIGFLAISGTAFLIYRRNQRDEKIALIKQRLKGK